MTMLSALYAYYQRLAAMDDPPVPPLGFKQEKIHVALPLNPDGTVAGEPIPLGTPNKKGELQPLNLFVPHPGGSRTSGVKPYFLWDKSDYVFGVKARKVAKGEDPAWDMREKHFSAFRQLAHDVIGDHADAGLRAVLRFLDRWQPEHFDTLPGWQHLLTGNTCFQLVGDGTYIHDRPAAQQVWREHLEATSDSQPGFCLVTGEASQIKRLHNPIQGVKGAQSSGAGLVSFNASSFCSYNKDQSWNAPVGEVAEGAYTSALNYLLAKGSTRRTYLGDITVTFWSENAPLVENAFTQLMYQGKPKTKEDTATTSELEVFLQRFRHLGNQGQPTADLRPDAKFYILGLSPNASRLSVRFWFEHTLASLSQRLEQHFSDLAVVREFDNQPQYPGVLNLLAKTAVKGKFDAIPDKLIGDTLRAIFTGQAYPASLLQACITRIRAERTVPYERAALIKACLIRRTQNQSQTTEVSMSLEPNSPWPAYQMGRLFAVLERIQDAAADRKVNAGLRDRYFASAMSTPFAVFPLLLKLSNTHLSKLRKTKAGFAVNLDKMSSEILANLSDDQSFPKFLGLENQGRFALGYYHQRQEFFTKKDKEGDNHDAE